VQPFGCVFYPVSALPAILRPVAYALPCTYVFEGMRNVLSQGVTSATIFWAPILLNIVYLTGAWLFFKSRYRAAQERGLLTKLGE
jgi:ABC-2 type transport system permease protein